LFIYLQ